MKIEYQKNANLLKVDLKDSLDNTFCRQLKSLLGEKVGPQTLLTLDFAKVEFLGSHIVSYIIGAYEAVNFEASRLKLINVSESAYLFLQSLKFDAMFVIQKQQAV